MIRQWERDIKTNSDVAAAKAYMVDVVNTFDKRTGKEVFAYRIVDHDRLRIQSVQLLSYEECLVECDKVISDYCAEHSTEPDFSVISDYLDSKVTSDAMFLKEDRDRLDEHFKAKLQQMRKERLEREFVEMKKGEISDFLYGSIERENVTPSMETTSEFISGFKRESGEALDAWMISELKLFAEAKIIETEETRCTLEREKFNSLVASVMDSVIETCMSSDVAPTYDAIVELAKTAIAADARYTSSDTPTDIADLIMPLSPYMDVCVKITEEVYNTNRTPSVDDVFEKYGLSKDDSQLYPAFSAFVSVQEAIRVKKEQECFESMQAEVNAYLERLSLKIFYLPSDEVVYEHLHDIVASREAFVRADAEELLKQTVHMELMRLKAQASKFVAVKDAICSAFDHLHEVTTSWDVKIFGVEICISSDVDLYPEKWSNYQIPNSSKFARELSRYAPLVSYEILSIVPYSSSDQPNIKYKAVCRFDIKKKKSREYMSMTDEIYLTSGLKIVFVETFQRTDPVNVENEFDEIRRLLAQIEAKDAEIKAYTKTKHKDIYSAYSKYYKSYDLDIDYDAPGNTVSAMQHLCEVQGDLFGFIGLRDVVSGNTDKIMAAKKDAPDVIKAYSTFMSGVSLAWALPQTAPLDDVIQTQGQVLDFIAKRQQLNTLNAEIKQLSSNAKYIYKLYSEYHKGCDLSWTRGGDHAVLDECLNIAAAVNSLLHRDDIETINNTARKNQTINIKEIICQ